MAPAQSDFMALQLLASVALDAHKILCPLAIETKSGLAANIATQLFLIAEGLSDLELSQIAFDASTVSIEALHDLVTIAQIRKST